MEKSEIVIVPVNGWIGVYVDGILQFQNHPWRLPEMTWIKLGMEFPEATIQKRYASADWFEKWGSLPDELEGVVFGEE
jgi:hypothetical protein